MQSDLVKVATGSVSETSGGLILPAIIAEAGERAGKRFIEFFTATIRNTRRAYARAVGDFLAWCQQGNLTLTGIEPVHVAAYIERLIGCVSKASRYSKRPKESPQVIGSRCLVRLNNTVIHRN